MPSHGIGRAVSVHYMPPSLPTDAAWGRIAPVCVLITAILLVNASSSAAQEVTRPDGVATNSAPQTGQSASGATQPTPITVTCSSKPGGRESCPADTSAGVVLLQSTGE